MDRINDAIFNLFDRIPIKVTATISIVLFVEFIWMIIEKL